MHALLPGRAGHVPAGGLIAGILPPRDEPGEFISLVQRAAQHPAAADLPDVIAPGERADLHEKRTFPVDLGRVHLMDDRFEKGVHSFVRVLMEVLHEPAVEAGAVQNREMRLLVRRPQIEEEIERLVQRVVGAGVRTIDLVDDDDGAESQPERAHEHVPGLRHRPFVGVHEEENRIDHREHPLHLA